MTKATIEFWYDFASTYSYLTACRIQSAAQKSNVNISWQPFLLGPIFKKQGLTTSPFVANKPKGEYMWRDIERSAKIYNIPFQKSAQDFPQNSLLAARVALCLKDGTARAEFSKNTYLAEFAQSKNIADTATIAEILEKLGHNATNILQQTQSPEIKHQLFTNSEQAISNGMFGAPSFLTTDGELFWGDDRLQQALDWAAK